MGSPKPGPRVTLKSIALKAGVSVVSAGIALNPSAYTQARVSEATKIKVQRIAESLHYKPNPWASGLRKKNAGRIGFASDRFDDLSNNAVRHRVLRESVRLGLGIEPLSYDAAMPVSAFLPDILSKDLERLVIYRFWDRMAPGEKSLLQKKFFGRLLVIDHDGREDPHARGVSFIFTEKNIAWAELYQRIGQTHRRIGALSYSHPPAIPGRSHFADPRPGRFQMARKASGGGFGGMPDVHFCNLEDPDAIYQATKKMVEAGYDAIQVHHDQAAPIVYRAIWDSGKRIPEDVGVTGYDDLYFSPYMRPSLTTIHIDMAGFAEGILNWLSEPFPFRVVPHRLMDRESLRGRRPE